MFFLFLFFLNLFSRIFRYVVLDLGLGFLCCGFVRWVEGDSGRWVCINCCVGLYYFVFLIFVIVKYDYGIC